MNRWQTYLPYQLDLGRYKEDLAYLEITQFLHNLHFDVNLLIEENLLYHFKMRPIATKLALPLGIHLKPKLLWGPRNLDSPLAIIRHYY